MDEPKSEWVRSVASSSEPPHPVPVIDAAARNAISEEILRHQTVLIMLVQLEGSLLVNKIHEMNQGMIASTVSDLLGLIKEELKALNQKMKIPAPVSQSKGAEIAFSDASTICPFSNSRGAERASNKFQ